MGLSFGLCATASAVNFTENPVAACSKIAAESQSQGVPLLLLGIEGTLQYDSHDANSLFAFSLAKKARPGLQAIPPLRKWGGLLTNGLLFPLMREFGGEVDAVSFNFDLGRDRNEAAICAKTWMRFPNHKLMIIGHSSGGQEADHFAAFLRANGVAVDTLV
ncbi:MAG: hypothetical protein ACXWSR_22335, partial [Bdellovibrionota bacterium]